MTFLNKFTAQATVLMAGSLLLQGIMGFHQTAQAAQPLFEDFHHRDRMGNEWAYWNDILGWSYKKQEKQVGSHSLEVGQHVERWPDGTRVVADTGGLLYASNTGIQPVSEKTCPSPQATCPSGITPVQPVSEATTCPPKKAKKASEARASDLSPGHILVDEYGRRIEMANNGVVDASSRTAVSLVPDWSPGISLTDEKKMVPDVFQRVFPENKVAGKPTILPATATASILPAGTTIAAAGCEQPVSVGTCPAGFTTKDKERIGTYFNDELKRANLLPSQYLALSPAQQQQVLSGEQLTIPVSGLVNPCPIPNNIQAQLVRGNTLSSDVISQYGVAVPDKLNKKLSDLPTGYQRMMIGGTMVVLSPNNQVVDTYSVLTAPVSS